MDTAYRFGDWLVQPDLNRVSIDDDVRQVEPLTMDVLAYLLAHPEQVVPSDELLDRLWPDRHGDPSMIKKRIGQIRRVLSDDAKRPTYIQTIAKRGYRTIAPVERIGVAGADLVDVGPTQAKPTIPSIAVLPLVNIGDTGDYFSDGVTEEILNRMTRLRDVRVISRQSSFVYRDSALDVREIGKQLGADYILQGSVRRGADLVRIGVHLTDTADGTEMWSNSYDRELTDILRLQDEIARVAISEFVPNIGIAPSSKPDVDPVAYDLYLRGRSAIRAHDYTSAKPFLRAR